MLSAYTFWMRCCFSGLLLSVLILQYLYRAPLVQIFHLIGDSTSFRMKTLVNSNRSAEGGSRIVEVFVVVRRIADAIDII